MAEKKSYFRALTIGGSDSSGGAGIQADIKTFSALGCYGMSAITVLTSQNTQGVFGIQEISPEFVVEQITSVLGDIGVDAVKIGMLFNTPIIKKVAKCMRENRGFPVVLDPVMFAKSGDRLLKKDAIDTIRDELFPLATLVTPNIPEASALLGRPIESPESMQEAAVELCALGPQGVVIKGGSLLNRASDDCMFVKNGQLQWLKQERIDTQNIHGTGCTFSSAITAFLAQSFTLEDSVLEAKKYVSKAIKAGSNKKLGLGKGPVMHFYKTWKS
ncbi:MAG: bifunctional hydroxymethylpyrimidine kinase/phosphomethylpyrimidine kinase [Nitrospina sp.]|nr:bifunctional hydroxymethylpyrimidine kinase/phosphomethylpyrimidine kinase [Nitrospina sp.]